MGLLILFLVMGALAVPLWAISKMVQTERKPRLLVRKNLLVVETNQENKEYPLTSINHFLVVTTLYFGASGNITRKEFFLVGVDGTKTLFHSRDPISKLSGDYGEFISRLGFLTGKPVQLETLVEDLNGKVMTPSDFKKQGNSRCLDLS